MRPFQLLTKPFLSFTLLFLLIGWSSCSNQEEANQLLKEAKEAFDQGFEAVEDQESFSDILKHFDSGMNKLEEILQEYPDTEVAEEVKSGKVKFRRTSFQKLANKTLPELREAARAEQNIAILALKLFSFRRGDSRRDNISESWSEIAGMLAKSEDKDLAIQIFQRNEPEDHVEALYYLLSMENLGAEKELEKAYTALEEKLAITEYWDMDQSQISDLLNYFLEKKKLPKLIKLIFDKKKNEEDYNFHRVLTSAFLLGDKAVLAAIRKQIPEKESASPLQKRAWEFEQLLGSKKTATDQLEAFYLKKTENVIATIKARTFSQDTGLFPLLDTALVLEDILVLVPRAGAIEICDREGNYEFGLQIARYLLTKDSSEANRLIEAHFLTKMGKVDEAKQLIAQNRYQIEIAREIVEHYLRNNDWKSAVNTADLLASPYGNGMLKAKVVSWLIFNNKTEEAEELLQEIVSMRSKMEIDQRSIFNYRLASLYGFLGEEDKAESYFEDGYSVGYRFDRDLSYDWDKTANFNGKYGTSSYFVEEEEYYEFLAKAAMGRTIAGMYIQNQSSGFRKMRLAVELILHNRPMYAFRALRSGNAGKLGPSLIATNQSLQEAGYVPDSIFQNCVSRMLREIKIGPQF